MSEEFSDGDKRDSGSGCLWIFLAILAVCAVIAMAVAIDCMQGKL
jgi:flagellar basal body-associated protein FliL